MNTKDLRGYLWRAADQTRNALAVARRLLAGSDSADEPTWVVTFGPGRYLTLSTGPAQLPSVTDMTGARSFTAEDASWAAHSHSTKAGEAGHVMPWREALARDVEYLAELLRQLELAGSERGQFAHKITT